MNTPKIFVHSDNLPTLLTAIKSGQIQVPRFQRDFVWPLSKTRKLLDSMFKEFPIGSFFLWEAPAGAPLLSRPLPELGIPAPQPGTAVTYILDGQQRLTSLFCVIFGIRFGSRNYGRISIDLKTATDYISSQDEDFAEDIFVYRTGDNNRYVAVKDIVGLEHLTIFNQIPDEWKNAYNFFHNLFTIYPFSVVSIRDQLLGNAIEIFQRINQSGKPLSRFDLVCANVWRDDFDFRKKVAEINRIYIQKGYGKIDETIFTQIFAMVAFDQCTTAYELSLETDKIETTWKNVIKSLGLAVDYLVHNMGVVRYDVLPYRGLLVVLTYFFYHSGGNISVTDREILWSWFWRTTLSERYSSTSPSRMAEDAKILIEHLSGEPAEFKYAYHVSMDNVLRTKMTSTSSALRNATLCMLALKEPRNFKDNSIVNLKDQFFSNLKKAERHHIFPVGYLKKENIDSRKVHLLANFCFIPSNLNSEISSQPPAKYFKKYKEDNPSFAHTIKTHLIPAGNESAVWENDFDKFLKERSQLIAEELNIIVDQGVLDLRPQEPTASDGYVDILEIKMRDFIDHRLTAMVGEIYWKEVIPSDVNEKVKERINEQISRHPYESAAEYARGRKKLDFCDVGHYEKIIFKNWSLFQDYFQRKDDFSKHISAFRNLRNSIQHNREPSDIDQQNGEAAILWLSRIIDRYFTFEDEIENINGDEVEYDEIGQE